MVVRIHLKLGKAEPNLLAFDWRSAAQCNCFVSEYSEYAVSCHASRDGLFPLSLSTGSDRTKALEKKIPPSPHLYRIASHRIISYRPLHIIHSFMEIGRKWNKILDSRLLQYRNEIVVSCLVIATNECNVSVEGVPHQVVRYYRIHVVPCRAVPCQSINRHNGLDAKPKQGRCS